MKYVQLLVAIVMSLPACRAPESQTAPLRLTTSQCAAISAAEEFIASHGYTARPPTATAEELARSNTSDFPLEKILPLRRASMRPHAVGISHGVAIGRPGWTVVFESNPDWVKRHSDAPRPEEHAAPVGAGVQVPVDGNITLEQVGYLMSAIEIRLPDPGMVQRACQSQR